MAITVGEFWSHVESKGPDECWPWTGKTDQNGYGLAYFKVGEGFPPMIHAHRAALHLSGVPVRTGTRENPGDFVMHSCDNPPCCNPHHLKRGTARDNYDDMVAKGRGDLRQYAGGPGGGRKRKITPDQAAEIRSVYTAAANKHKVVQGLSVQFGVSRETIRGVTRYRGAYRAI